MSNELIVAETTNPATLFHRATDVAGVCGEIVKRTAQYIQGRRYVRVEGWQSIAAAYGCVASATNVRRMEHGFMVTGELRRLSDGAIIASAEGYVGDDEPTWFGGEVRGKTLPKRPDYAIQAMAQTRAISRVCRTAFAFVVVMIDNKLSTTPAEEMQGIDMGTAEVLPPDETGAGGSSPPGGGTSPAAASASSPTVTRSQTLRELCAKAYADGPANEVKALDRAGVASAEEMSNEDWDELCAALNRRIAEKSRAK